MNEVDHRCEPLAEAARPNAAPTVERDIGHRSDLLCTLLHARSSHASLPVPGAVVVGRLLALTDNGCTALVTHPCQGAGDTALRAGTVVALRGEHVGQPVVLAFEDGDGARPIVMGLLRGASAPLASPLANQVEVDADGERLVLSARKQLTLRCGNASITLTQAGKVLINGTYVLSRSSGVNRVKGGSIQLN